MVKVVGTMQRESDSADAFAGGGWNLVAKASDEARSANASLTVDNALKATLGVGRWRVRLLAFLSSGNATMDFKYATAFTGTATVKAYRRKHITAGAVAGTDNENVAVGASQIASTAVTATTSGIATVQIDMVLNVTVSGEFQFQWAQNTSDASNLTCLEGSTLEYVAT